MIKRSNTSDFKDENKKLEKEGEQHFNSEEEDNQQNSSEEEIEEHEIHDHQALIDEHEEAKKIDSEMQT